MQLSIAYDFSPKRRSINAAIVMDHFGIDFEQGRHVIADALALPIRPGDVVFFTGPSGSGKSSLLRALTEQLKCAVWADHVELGDAILADSLPLPIEQALDLLSACGLSEAYLLLRTPAELSDGQRYRFRLAKAIALASTSGIHTGTGVPPVDSNSTSTGGSPVSSAWVIADEFTANLDRTLAQVIAFNVRRLAWRRRIGFLLATTHEDIIDDLNPDVLVRCRLEGRIEVERRDVKKNQSVWRMTYGSAMAPDPTGRTSRAGITEAPRSRTSAG